MGKRKPHHYQQKLQKKVEDLNWMLERFRRIANIGQEKLAYGHLSHSEMAGMVYMLGRQDLEFQAVVHGARDRIIWLANQVAVKDHELAELQKQLDLEISNRTGNHVGGVINKDNDPMLVKQTRMAALRDVLNVVRNWKTIYNDNVVELSTTDNANELAHFKSAYEACGAIGIDVTALLERTIRNQTSGLEFPPEKLLLGDGYVTSPLPMVPMPRDKFKGLVEKLKDSLANGDYPTFAEVDSLTELVTRIRTTSKPHLLGTHIELAIRKIIDDADEQSKGNS